jgi:hypothetical protein
MLKKAVVVILVLALLSVSSLFAQEEVPYKKSIAIRATQEINLDGYSDEWEEMMGLLVDPMYTGDTFDAFPMSAMWMQWDEENLYVLVRVMDTQASVAQPDQFWAVDSVELFIDGLNVKGEGYDRNSAQFWFCPGGAGADGDELYVGQWHREGDAIDATLYGGVPGIEGALSFDDNGYIMEIKISAAALALDFGFLPNQVIGFNYTVFDVDKGMGTFWATSKAVKNYEHPSLWGKIILKN